MAPTITTSAASKVPARTSTARVQRRGFSRSRHSTSKGRPACHSRCGSKDQLNSSPASLASVRKTLRNMDGSRYTPKRSMKWLAKAVPTMSRAARGLKAWRHPTAATSRKCSASTTKASAAAKPHALASPHSRPLSAASRKGRLADSSQNRLSARAAVSVEAVQVQRCGGVGGAGSARGGVACFFKNHIVQIVVWLAPDTCDQMWSVGLSGVGRPALRFIIGRSHFGDVPWTRVTLGDRPLRHRGPAGLSWQPARGEAVPTP